MCNVQLQSITIIVIINVIIIVLVNFFVNVIITLITCLICATPDLILCRYILVHSSGKCNFDSWHERLHLQARRVSTALSVGSHLSSQSSVVAPRVFTRSYGIRSFQIIYQAPSPHCSLIVGTYAMLFRQS